MKAIRRSKARDGRRTTPGKGNRNRSSTSRGRIIISQNREISYYAIFENILNAILVTKERDFSARYQGGANGSVRKPIDFNQFTEVVKQPRLSWLISNGPPES